MRRAPFRDHALVVRTYDFGEADRIVVLITRDHGLRRGVAKGVRRSKSRFGSRLQRFVDLDVNLYPGRNLDTISGADTIDFFGSGIIEDYERYTAGCAMLEAAERLALADGDEDPWLYVHLRDALSDLRQTSSPTALLDAFLLQAMGHSGWAPSLFNCAACGEAGPHHAFHPSAGGAVCVNCRPPGSADVDEEVLHIMWLLAEGHLEAAEAQSRSANGASLREAAHRLTSWHLQWHAEKRLASLGVMEQR